MPYPKHKPEYFLRRIKQFHEKNGRVPRSNEFNGPFHKNVMNYFGSWAEAVRRATGVELNCSRKTDDQLLEPIKNYYMKYNKIIPMDTLICRNTLINRFGSVNAAVYRATGVDIYLTLLRTVNDLMVNGVACVTLNEILEEISPVLSMNNNQLRGTIAQCIGNGWIEVRRGDRIALYSITKLGKLQLTVNNNGNRSR